MADAFTRVPPDSTGDRIDTTELTVAATTVQRQRVQIAGNADVDLCPVNATSGVKVDLGSDNDVTVASGTVTSNAGTGDRLLITGHTTNEALKEASCMGGQLDDAATTAATENNVAAVRITAQRGVHVNLRNVAGTEIGTTANPVAVTDDGTAILVDGSAVTQPVSGTVTANAGTGDVLSVTGHTRNEGFKESAAIGGELDDTTPVVATEGNVSPVRITAQRGMHVNFRDNGGTEIGTAANPIAVTDDGTAILVDGSAVTQPISAASEHARNDAFVESVAIGGELDDTGPVAATEGNVSPVRITAQRGMHANLRTAAGVEFPAGGGTEAAALRVTVANDSTGVVTVDGTVTADAGTGTFTVDGSAVTQPVSGTVTSNAGTGDRLLVTGHTINESFKEASAVGGQLDDTATTAATENNIAPVRITAQRSMHMTMRDSAGDSAMDDTNNALRVNIVAGSAGATEFAEDAAHTTGAAGPQVLGVRRDADTSPVTADNDYHHLVFDNAGALKTHVKTSALPADAATATNQLADGHNVTIDNASGASAVNIQDGGNAITVDGTVTANAGTGTLLVDLAGNNDVTVTGSVAHDAADSGNPAKVGMKAIAHGGVTAVAANDRTDWYANRDGIPFVMAGHPNILTLRLNATGVQTNVAVVTQGAGGKLVVTRLSATLDNATTVDVQVRIGFGATTTPTTTGVLLSHPGLAAGSGVVEGNGSGMLGVGADGEDLRVTSEVPTTGSLDIVVTYYVIDS